MKICALLVPYVSIAKKMKVSIMVGQCGYTQDHITCVPYGYSFRRKYVLCQLASNLNVKQKHLGCKKVRGQSEAACKQAGATKTFGIT